MRAGQTVFDWSPTKGTNGGELLVVTNNRQRVFQRSIIAGAEEAGGDRDYRVEVLEVPRQAQAPAMLDRLIGLEAGLLLIADVLPDDLVASLHDAGANITLVSHWVEGLDVPSIMHDNRQGMEILAGEVLDRCGRNRPLFLRGSSRQQDADERHTAFERELMRRGLAVDRSRFLEGEFEPEQAARALGEYLETGGEFDSIVSADYLMAIACLEVLAAKGLAVPGQIAVAGYGDGPEAELAGLTTVAADVVELGRRAARQLMGQREGLEIRGLTLLSTALCRRASTG